MVSVAPPHQLPRRRLLWSLAAGPWALAACAPSDAVLLRVGAQPWPGFELMYLARARRYFSNDRVRLIEVPSSSASLRALASQALEGAALTLDEVLTARAHGLPLTVVAVLDVSRGADVVMSRPDITTPAELAGRRIGVETSATGAVMLDAVLQRAGLRRRDVKVISLAIDEHAAAYRNGKVDAVVSYEPVKTRLIQAGARVLFSSADVPGRIVDTLAMRTDVLAPPYESQVRALVAGHFRARDDWQTDPVACSVQIAPRLKLPPAEVPAAFADLDLPGVQANRDSLSPQTGGLLASAARLQEVMLRAGLLRRPVDMDRLVDGGFLPGRA